MSCNPAIIHGTMIYTNKVLSNKEIPADFREDQKYVFKKYTIDETLLDGWLRHLFNMPEDGSR